MTTKKWLVAMAAVSAALTLGIGVVWAQEADGDDSGPSLLDRVAQKLGIDTPRLEQAIEDARSEQIDEAVQNGDLTPEEGERLKERLDELPANAPFLGVRHGPGFDGPGGLGFAFGFGGPGLHFGFGGLELRGDIAGFLGITEEQLEDELQADGATLATVAEAHGKTRDELKAFIESEVRERLGQAVADGDLTQEQADDIGERLSEHLDDLIDGELPKFGGLHRRGPGFTPLGDVADFLGIDRAQLLDELRADGATLASVAQAHGKGRDELKSFLETNARERLVEAVSDGDITQEQADEKLEAYSSRLDETLDREWTDPPAFRRFRERFEDGDDPDEDGEVPQSFESGIFRS